MLKDYVKFQPAELERNTFKVLKSKRSFGIELEFASCMGSTYALNRETRFGWKPDGTSGVQREIYSPPLTGDLGMIEVAKICATAKFHRWMVTNRCGFHLHIGVPETECLTKIALAYRYTAPLWFLWVNKDRQNNSYCRRQMRREYLVKDLVNDAVSPEEMIEHCGGDRYKWINYLSMRKYQTIENRLHEGTSDWMTIKNWIKANLLLVDWAVKSKPKTICNALATRNLPRKFHNLCRIWNDDSMYKFYLKKALENKVDLQQKCFDFIGV
jgi:hypothetical protein